MSMSQAIQTLVEHPEANGIHKLLYWVYTGRWESNVASLERSAIRHIVPELVGRTATYEVLERRLYKAASVLNKPEKYRQIAALILQTCAILYPSVEPNLLPPPSPAMTALWATDLEDAMPMTTIAQPDRFELRRRVMLQVPPLKVKILLFSILRHPFSFGSMDWKDLRTQSLDVWLAEALQKFPRMDLLETQLFAQAAELSALEQGSQVADAIMQAVRL